MSDKKNIDRLFQEKFKDFEAAPPQFVWDNIEEILKEKKKRRVLPLWVRLGGVAAVLILGLLFILPDTASNTKNGVVIDKQQISPAGINPIDAQKPASTGKGITPPNRNVQGSGPAASPDAMVSAPDNGPEVNTSVVKASGSGNSQRAVRGQGNPQRVMQNAKNGTVVAHNRNNQTGGHNNNKHNAAMSAEQGVAHNQVKGNRNGQLQNGTMPGSNNTFNGLPETPDSPVQTLTSKPHETGVAGIENYGTQPVSPNSPSLINTPATDIINRDIPVTPDEAVAITPTDTLPENPLEKLKREQEAEKDKAVAENEAAGGKWNVKPQMGPLLYSSLSSGSPIDAQFASNSKSYDNQLSYGVGVNYNLSKKLSLRSGVNTVNLSYATEGVQFYASLNQGTNNVARTTNANIVVQNQQPTGGFASAPASLTADQLPQEKFNGAMMQKTGYIEVPVEMSYALLDKKFGINLIGGVSTLFLNQNNVSVISNQGLSTDVGEAQNLNNIHFSTNLGVGFKYKFFKQFEASFEPTFKYQVNAYSRDAGNFKPYFIGLYTGVSFSF